MEYKERITLNLSIQVKIAEFIDEIWVEWCKKLFRKEMNFEENSKEGEH